MKRIIILLLALAMLMALCGCAIEEPDGERQNVLDTQEAANRLTDTQRTPTDIDYSLERYNLIRRAYWVNGQREKANMLPCEVTKPLGYIVLFAGPTVAGRFVVDGKVSSLNSYLSPDSEYYEIVYGGSGSKCNKWLADVDGSYGENDNGIFFFTPNGNYIEWTGEYLYSDIPIDVTDPVISYEVPK